MVEDGEVCIFLFTSAPGLYPNQYHQPGQARPVLPAFWGAVSPALTRVNHDHDAQWFKNVMLNNFKADLS